MRNEEKKLSGSAYIRHLFENTVGGKLTIGYDEETKGTFPMAWDAGMAEEVAAHFDMLVQHLEAIAKVHDSLGDRQKNADLLTEDQLTVWEIFVTPFPDHGMDHDVLQEISMKEEMGEELAESEKRMLQRQQDWFLENALKRLPYKACSPAALISRARRYERLVSLKAPQIVVDNEARRMAEEMVLYCCAKPFHICRCCGCVYALDEAGVMYSICPNCMWEEDFSQESEFSDVNCASLKAYRKSYLEKQQETDTDS